MPQRRMLHVITQLEFGGAQGTTLELLRRLSPQEYALTLVTSAGGPHEAQARTIPGLTLQVLPSLARAIDPWRDLAAVRELTRFMQTHRFTIVHTHSSKAGILGRWAAYRAGVPVICHSIHGFAFHPFQPAWIRRAYQAAERAAARVTTSLITVSRYDRQQGLVAGIGRPEQYQHIPYGIDLDRFHRNGLSPEMVRTRFGLNPHAPTIGTIACLKPQKAVHEFLDVCARLRARVPNVQAVVVGDGVLRPQLERQRRALGLEGVVQFLGWQRDIPSVLTALDVFVLTSRWEGLPVAMLEAQAMRVPVVVTDTGGVRDAIDDGVHGFIVPIGDRVGMCERIAQLLTDPAMARDVAERAHRSVAERFVADRMVRHIEAVYEAALSVGAQRGV